ncbi:alpha/beta hydrolase fold protein [Beutenbergia cavernae DSM 12333]|uniref:Alpha/beta hydrolase fold protein n=1 Tax=Beutenbergia cavernae (strain ATCC BAA-8 / DSM 12333 / CCUG 43141 / JCM 11478 / NBRC 16432 / NCIMB 13614 / HKI 0122) TaxID=471853 RepID=C5C4J9_BEUC1|nr:alpha/beta hydrolase [Beutenbergia cavernae]ACQ82123.1 alpha/beta hydrolase fold protein [Beutenbergia cavernae DSM 12333]
MSSPLKTSTDRTRTATSADGTRIAYEQTGSGPPLVLVEAAGHYRRLSSFDGLVPLLATAFTVVRYDRRGRGESTDTPPYAVEREAGDLAAVIAAVGAPAFVHTFSSGALVALQAAAAGVAIARLSLAEPPVGDGSDAVEQRRFTAELERLVEASDNDGAVEFFLTSVGVPEDMLAGMRGTESWQAMVDVAPTLVYDSLASLATTTDLLADILIPTLVLASSGSSADLVGMADDVARGLPHGNLRTVDGDWHGLPDDAVADELRSFFLT